jgi:hypothetical protein
MKKITLTIVMASGLIFPVFGQLNTVHNHFRAGDVLIKQQVDFTDSGQAGENKL